MNIKLMLDNEKFLNYFNDDKDGPGTATVGFYILPCGNYILPR